MLQLEHLTLIALAYGLLTPNCIAAWIGICKIPGLYVKDLHTEHNSIETPERALLLPQYIDVIALPA